jgi:hypothetical protein
MASRGERRKREAIPTTYYLLSLFHRLTENQLSPEENQAKKKKIGQQTDPEYNFPSSLLIETERMR